MEWQLNALVGVLAALGLCLPLIAERVYEHRLNQAGLPNLSHMTDEDIRLHMMRLLTGLGYRLFQPSADAPELDLILVDGLNQRRGVVVRSWRTVIDRDVVTAAAEAARRMEMAAPMIISVNGYTHGAKEEATHTGAILWGVRELAAAMKRLKQVAVAVPDLPALRTLAASAEQAETEASLTPPPKNAGVHYPLPAVTPRCPRCGRKMLLRPGARGDYWACSTFPRCLGSLSRGHD